MLVVNQAAASRRRERRRARAGGSSTTPACPRSGRSRGPVLRHEDLRQEVAFRLTGRRPRAGGGVTDDSARPPAGDERGRRRAHLEPVGWQGMAANSASAAPADAEAVFGYGLMALSGACPCLRSCRWQQPRRERRHAG